MFPITFDKETIEYYITFANGSLLIYHCPFCGGAAPTSQRDLQFAKISMEEDRRLSSLLAPVKTIADAIRLFGEPDFNGYSKMIKPESGQEPPVIRYDREIIYTKLSDFADVHIQEWDGRAAWQLIGKYRGPAPEGK